MGQREVEVEVEELEIGNEAYVVAGKITFLEVYDEQGEFVVDWKEVDVEIGIIQRMYVRKIPQTLPANVRARLILKHSQTIKDALRKKFEADQEDAREAMADRD